MGLFRSTRVIILNPTALSAMAFCISSTSVSKRFVLPVALIVFALVVAGCDQNLSSSESGSGEMAAPQRLPDGSLPDTSKSKTGRRIGPDALAGVITNGVTPPALAQAIEVQDRHTPDLLGKPSIVGTAVGLNGSGKPEIVVYTKESQADVRAVKNAVPAQLEGVPVSFQVTGLITIDADETSRRRPAPLGFSVGNANVNSAGTIGARVKDDNGTVYILSNNHVLANLNQATIGDDILQPGPFDGGTNPEDRIATLSAYESIDFSGDNVMDAAIASSTTAKLSNSTSSEGYGTPNSVPYTLDSDGDGSTDQGVIGLAAQKYGRSTGLTQGEVSEINGTISVCTEADQFGNCRQSATFKNVITFLSPGSGDFSERGDSGSLIVTNDESKNPIALLFAGSRTRDRTFGNPIKPILNRFDVVIDGTGGGTEPPCTDCTAYTGTLSGSGDYEFEPDGSYYYTSGGTQRGYLRGPSDANYDLLLQKSQGGGWVTVASSTSGDSSENIEYNASSGFFIWRIESQNGSGPFDFYLQRP